MQLRLFCFVSFCVYVYSVCLRTTVVSVTGPFPVTYWINTVFTAVLTVINLIYLNKNLLYLFWNHQCTQNTLRCTLVLKSNCTIIDYTYCKIVIKLKLHRTCPLGLQFLLLLIVWEIKWINMFSCRSGSNYFCMFFLYPWFFFCLIWNILRLLATPESLYISFLDFLFFLLGCGFLS